MRPSSPFQNDRSRNPIVNSQPANQSNPVALCCSMRIRSAVTVTSQIVSAGVSDPLEFLSGGKTRTFCPKMTYASPLAAVLEGAVERVRPKMMTATAIMARSLPILWGTGAGASVMKRIAAPMIGE